MVRWWGFGSAVLTLLLLACSTVGMLWFSGLNTQITLLKTWTEDFLILRAGWSKRLFDRRSRNAVYTTKQSRCSKLGKYFLMLRELGLFCGRFKKRLVSWLDWSVKRIFAGLLFMTELLVAVRAFATITVQITDLVIVNKDVRFFQTSGTQGLLLEAAKH